MWVGGRRVSILVWDEKEGEFMPTRSAISCRGVSTMHHVASASPVCGVFSTMYIQFSAVRFVLYSTPYHCLNPYYGRTSNMIFGNRGSSTVRVGWRRRDFGLVVAWRKHLIAVS
jgi:hypothetical protein